MWGCTWPSFLDGVIKAQKAVLRVISYKGKYESTESVFTVLGLMNIQSVHRYFVIINIFRLLSSNCSNTELFKLQDHNLNTRRNQVNLICPVYRTILFNNSILCIGPKMWNSLPNDLKGMLGTGTLICFKHKLKTYIYSQQIH